LFPSHGFRVGETCRRGSKCYNFLDGKGFRKGRLCRSMSMIAASVAGGSRFWSAARRMRSRVVRRVAAERLRSAFRCSRHELPRAEADPKAGPQRPVPPVRDARPVRVPPVIDRVGSDRVNALAFASQAPYDEVFIRL